MMKKHVLQVVLVLALMSFPLTAFAAPSDPPTVTTMVATQSDGVTLQGETTFDGVTDYGFEYGETTDYGTSVSGEDTLTGYSFSQSFGEQGSATNQFANGPGYAETGPFGNTFVSDYWDGILKFDSDGNFVSRIGSYGSSDGQFGYVKSFTFDESGNIYVVDLAPNMRIQKFDNDGNFLMKIGSSGSTDGKFRSPSDIALDATGNIYVLDAGNDRVQFFNSAGQFISKFSYDSPSNWSAGQLLLDNSGNLYIADSHEQRVQKYSSAHILESSIPGPNTNFRISLIDNDNLQFYTRDTNNHSPTIDFYDSNLTLIKQFGSSNSETSNFYYSNGIYVQDDNSVIATFDGTVRKFTYSDITSQYRLKASDLDCETTYHYRAFATNANGTSYGEDQTFTTGDCSDVVTNLSGIATPTSVRISWDTDIQDGYWQIAYRPTSSSEWQSVDVYNDTNGKISGLDPSTEYVFRTRNSQNGNSGTWGLWSAPFVMSTLAAQTYEISTCQELQDIGWNPDTGETGDLEGNYKLTQDIDCAETSTWNEEPIDLGYMGLNISGFIPIGNFDFEANDMLDNAFVGDFDGRGHTISNLYQRGSTYMNGLFALTYGSEIKNLTLDGLNIELTKSQGYVGGLAGTTVATTIDNVHVNGQIVSVDGGVSKYSSRYTLEKTLEAAGNIYVSSYTGNEYEIVTLNHDGSVINKLEDLPSPEFGVDSLGNIYTPSQYEHSITKYSPEGNELSQIGQTSDYWDYQIDISSDDTIYINKDQHDIDLYSTQGILLNHVDVAMDESGNNQNFAVAPNGDFYIGVGGILYKFNSSGENLGRIGSGGSNEGEFNDIRGLSIAPNGNLYVFDSDNGRISIVSPSGEFAGHFSVNPEVNDGRPEIYNVSNLTISDDGTIYLTAARNLIHLDGNGNYLDTLTEESMGIFSAGGISGMGYLGAGESLSSVTRSSTNVDFDVNVNDQEMAFVSGGISFNSANISDSFASGDITVSAQGVETLGIAGLTTYNIGGSIERSYSSGDLDIESDGMVFAGGVVAGGMGVKLADNFYTGNISLDTPMGIASGIGAYLMEGEFDDSNEFMPLVLDNNKFDQSKAGTDICAFVMDENEEPMAVDEADCGAVNADGNDDSYFLGNSTASPLDKWDFESVWQTNSNALPTLQTVEIENETPVDDTDPDSDNGNDVTDLPPDNLPSKKQVSLNDLLPNGSNDPSVDSPATPEVLPLASIEQSKDKLLKVLGKEKTKDGNSAALKALIPKKSSQYPISPQLLAISTITMLGAALAFGKWYLAWKKTAELVIEKPSVFQGWK